MQENTTPNNSYYVRTTLLQNSWENTEIGENDLLETLGIKGESTCTLD